jgi:large subunit ribosomal protein L4
MKRKEEKLMLKIAVYNQEGTQVKDLELNESIFGIEPNNQAIFDMVLLQRASWRQGTHKVKNRTEVKGGGKKPWRQKGTGRARQGSIRAPQWRGGGIVFGPNTNRNYKIKLNRKVRQLALKSALSQKVIDSELTVLDNLALNAPKTKDMVKILANLDANRKTLIVMDEICENVALSARNIPGVKVIASTGLNVYDILDCTKLVMTEKAIAKVEEVLA